VSATAASTAPGALRTDELTTLAELEALRPEWSTLWRGVADASPFQSPEWLVPWWRSFGDTAGELAVLAMRAGSTNELVGVLPLYLHPPGGGGRTLLILGAGNSDHLDPLFRPDIALPCVEAALAEIAGWRGRWTDGALQQLRAGSPLLRARAPRGLVVERARAEPCVVVTLRRPSTGASSPPTGPLWERLLYLRRRATREARPRIEDARPDTVADAFDLLVRLHESRWRVRGEPGVLADPAARSFIRAASAALLAAGMLRLHLLYLHDEPAAALLAIAGRRSVAYYIGGFDPVHRHLAPGTLLVGHAIEAAARDGAWEFDFLRGAEPYKYRWGAVDRPTFQLLLRHRPA
jgi:CelD/BcsL family acetyltransferase involved in cellulose biosynthesis